MRVLHVFFSSVIKPQHKFLGTTKDIRGRTQYFEQRGIEYQELILKVREEKYFLEGLKRVDLSSFDAVLTEGTYFPRSVGVIKSANPRIMVLMRGINAEIFHWLHSAEAALRFDTWKRVLFDLKGTLDFGSKDILCARRADYILSIAEWESLNYWPRLEPRARVVTLPYFLPDTYLGDIPKERKKSDRCVCMMTTKANRPFLVDAARNFYNLVNGLGTAEPRWTFAITGDFHAGKLPRCPRVEVKGFLQNPLELLSESRAVALLSDYGFGFKTKLLEAICCGCRVLVTERLHERLPAPVQRWSIVVDPASSASFCEALERCASEPLPPRDPNGELRREAFEALDRVLGAPAARTGASRPAARLQPIVSTS